MYNAVDIANYFILASSYTKTCLQVMKLSFISHGYMLAIHDKPLIKDHIEAHKTGPIIPSINKAYKKWGSGIIAKCAALPAFNLDETEILRGVFKHYGKYDGFYLSQITHHDAIETPFEQVYEKGSINIIPDNIIQEYYKKIIKTK